IRLAGLPGVDIDGPSCSALHAGGNGAIKYADCYSDSAMIRDWKSTNTSPEPPLIEDVNLNSPTAACKFDLHFTTVGTGCTGGATVSMDWGARYDPATLSHAHYTVTVNGITQTRDAPTSPNTPWNFFGINPAAAGVGTVTLDWNWIDRNTND